MKYFTRYDYSKDIEQDTNQFISICGTIVGNLQHKTRKDFRKNVVGIVVPTLMNVSETWTTRDIMKMVYEQRRNF